MLKVKGKILDCPIYIATSNAWLPMLRPFSYLFNKFWSEDQKVTFLGYDKPSFDLPSNFDFVSLGAQRGLSYWADDIRPVLESCPSDYFIYTAEDQFITRPVDFSSLKNLLKVCDNYNPARIALTNTVSNQLFDDVDNEIVISNQNSNYRLSLIWSIWRKDYFLKHLHTNFSPWDFEVSNMSKVKMDGEDIIGCKENFPIGHCNAVQTRGAVNGFDYSKAKLNFLDVTSHSDPSKRIGLKEKYITEMLELGHIKESNL